MLHEHEGFALLHCAEGLSGWQTSELKREKNEGKKERKGDIGHAFLTNRNSDSGAHYQLPRNKNFLVHRDALLLALRTNIRVILHFFSF